MQTKILTKKSILKKVDLKSILRNLYSNSNIWNRTLQIVYLESHTWKVYLKSILQKYTIKRYTSKVYFKGIL